MELKENASVSIAPLAIQPVSDSEDSLIKQLEKKRGTKVVLLTMDESRSIDSYFVSQVYNLMEQLSSEVSFDNLDVIIHSGGGSADAAYHLAKILRGYCKGKLTFIVPRYAKSAATLLCCSGDEIIMDLPSELGPVDPQVMDYVRGVRYSALSMAETMKFLDKIEKECSNNEECNKVIKEAVGNIPLMEIGDNLRALNHIADYLHELLVEGMFKEEYAKDKDSAEHIIKNIVLNLVSGHYSHSKCIDNSKAKSMGLKIIQASKEEWGIIWKIFSMFEQEVLIKR